MAEETLEQKEEKKQSTWESVIGELGSFARKALLFGALAAMPLVYAPFNLAQVPRAAVTVAGFTAGQMASNMTRNLPLTEGIFNQGIKGNIISAPLAAGLYTLNNLETAVAANYGATAAKAAKVGAFLGVHQPAISTMRTALDYGLGKKFREYWWKGVKTTFYTIGLLGTFNVLYVYQLGLLPQMIYAGFLSFTFRFSNSIKELGGNFKNLYTRLNPIPHIGAGINATYKLAKTALSPLQALYEISSGLYKSAPKPPTPAPAPAPQPA